METNEETRPSARTELIAGVTTFFTMAYIVVVNPLILSTEGTGMPFSGVRLTAYCLLPSAYYFPVSASASPSGSGA